MAVNVTPSSGPGRARRSKGNRSNNTRGHQADDQLLHCWVHQVHAVQEVGLDYTEPVPARDTRNPPGAGNQGEPDGGRLWRSESVLCGVTSSERGQISRLLQVQEAQEA